MSSRKQAPRGGRVLGYIIAIAVYVALYYIFHNLQRWALPYIVTEEFSRVLPAIDLSLGATILANGLFIFFDPRWLKSLIQALLNLLALNSVYVLWRVFPLDLPGSLEPWAKRALILPMLAIAIAIIVQLFRVVLPSRRGED